MPADVTLQLDLALRLIIASVLGAAIGFEREIHEHPAGMRTHLLVALGSALFTELSIYGFVGVLAPGQGSAPDPTRIAAQIVSGIGFLGAGAILKYGTFIRGLTTAASLWATAAVGLAVGAGAIIIGTVGAAIVVFSLWPLHRFAERFLARRPEHVHLRLELDRLDALGAVTSSLSTSRIAISSVQSQRLGKGRYGVALDVQLRKGAQIHGVVETLSRVEGVEAVEVGETE